MWREGAETLRARKDVGEGAGAAACTCSAAYGEGHGGGVWPVKRDREQGVCKALSTKSACARHLSAMQALHSCPHARTVGSQAAGHSQRPRRLCGRRCPFLAVLTEVAALCTVRTNSARALFTGPHLQRTTYVPDRLMLRSRSPPACELRRPSAPAAPTRGRCYR